jgi:hypothetical protein
MKRVCDVEFDGVAASKLEMLREQGFEPCGVVMRKVGPTGVQVHTLSLEARVCWLDPVSVLGAEGALSGAKNLNHGWTRMDTDGKKQGGGK